MRNLNRLFLTFGLLFLVVQSVYSSSFTISQIQVTGNQRLSSAAILSYLPVRIGQSVDTADSTHIIQSLFKSGYFSDVRVFRQGHTLIIQVKEAPIISKLTFSGNKKITTEKLKPVLKSLKLQIGDVYSPEKLNEFRQGLINAYRNIGRYNVGISAHIEKKPYNTVVIHIVVKEGVTTKVHSIRFNGNRSFSSYTLRKQFTLTTPGLLTFFSHHDLYSPRQLDIDLASLENFYYDRGYLEFRVIAKKVTVSKDRQHADIFVQVHEGPIYRIGGYQLKGDFTNNIDIRKIVQNIHPGEIFSRKDIIRVNQQISNYLANRGYAFPKIDPVPHLNRDKKIVFLTIHIQSGHRVYVRFVHVAGNGRTTGKVLRYQMRQFEGSVYSLKDIEESKRRIANLPYFKDIEVSPQPVSGASNQVDLNYHVKEVSAGRASVQGGYSDVDGFIYGASIADPNFMGTGKYASIGFQNSAYSQQYSLGYTNPFYTTYGMSRGFNLYYTHTTPNDVNLDTYTMDTYGFSINYSLPVSEYDYLTFGYGYSHVAISNINPKKISPDAYQFLLLHPSPYNNFSGTVGIAHSNLDRAIFPMSGNFQQLSTSIGVPVFRSSLAYYKLDYVGRWYWRLGHQSNFVLHPHLTLGYGNGYSDVKAYPFFLNYYGGGIDTLPGYEPNTLGPKNPNDPGNSVGGNFEVFGGLNFIFPNGISDNIRTSLFVDFGNIFQTHKTAGNPGNPKLNGVTYEAIRFNNLRWSAGLLISWRSPFGVISVGYGIPFNTKPSDQKQRFGFTFGTSF